VSSTPLWPVWREGLPAEGWPRPGVVVGWAAAAAPLAAACWPARPASSICDAPRALIAILSVRL
jgi:hypothetical protein